MHNSFHHMENSELLRYSTCRAVAVIVNYHLHFNEMDL